MLGSLALELTCSGVNFFLACAICQRVLMRRPLDERERELYRGRKEKRERGREEKRERVGMCVCVLLACILSVRTLTPKPVRKQGMIKGDMKDFSQDAVENAEAVTPVGAHLVRRVTA